MATSVDTDSVLPDYKWDPNLYEREQAARPDEQALYSATTQLVNAILETHGPHAAILDMCCGTGLSLSGIISHRNLRRVVGIDNCEPYLTFAKQRFLGARVQPEFIFGDVLEAEIPEDSWAALILVSAYHHVEDDRKLAFLKRVRSLLSSGGKAILGENVLPTYISTDPESYRASVRQFYDQVKSDAVQSNGSIDRETLQTIERVAQYGFDGDYEYKVCYAIMMDHISQSGLEIERIARVWPTNAIGDRGGNYVAVLRAI